jgi:NADPH-dependent glutamate synthase beta subunit-like oxidoreductase/NAD-dependent dihydropyrimidine dehydrogenase PreA subunit
MPDKRVPARKLVIPPCTKACPAGVDVPRYIRAVGEGRYDDAVAIVRERLPLPTVCSDACFAPCEDVCAYKQFGDPVAIRALRRAAVDRAGQAWKQAKSAPTASGKRAAIVGAGPAGLTAAYYLVTKGHEVTLFDVFPKPGGTLRYGIPDYRMPGARLDQDIDDILELGVQFKGDTAIGKDISLAQLREDYDALFLATGANGSAKITLPGCGREGVLWGWEFLCDIALQRDVTLGGRLIVVGGGNVAIDVALTARRMGAEEVHLFCLEERDEMPAHEWEIQRAEEEGIIIHPCWGPQRILGDDAVTGVGFVRCTSVFDESGHFNPSYDEGTTNRIETDHVILAIGQSADLSFLKADGNVAISRGCIEVSETDGATGEQGIFAGGDVVSGPDSIVGAIAHGRRAAAAMDRHLGGDGDLSETLATPERTIALPDGLIAVQPRNQMKLLEPWRRSGFEQVELGLTDEQTRAEASRCLACDARSFEVLLDTEACKECGYCEEVCSVHTFGPAESYNEKGYRPQEVKSSDWCVGCFRCYFVCPDFAIDVRETSE